jgi:hypothetical protein
MVVSGYRYAYVASSDNASPEPEGKYLGILMSYRIVTGGRNWLEKRNSSNDEGARGLFSSFH